LTRRSHPDCRAIDDIRRAATERAMLTISEAVRHLPSDIIERNPDLQWDNMRGMGNRLRHEYWMIDAKIVWEVVQHDLDGLVHRPKRLIPKRLEKLMHKQRPSAPTQ